MTVVLLTAKDGQSMLRDEYLEEALRLNNFFVNNYTVDLDNRSSFKYKDACSIYCNLNIALDLFKVNFSMKSHVSPLIKNKNIKNIMLLRIFKT